MGKVDYSKKGNYQAKNEKPLFFFFFSEGCSLERAGLSGLGVWSRNVFLGLQMKDIHIHMYTCISDWMCEWMNEGKAQSRWAGAL